MYLGVLEVFKEIEHLRNVVDVVATREKFQCVDTLLPKTLLHGFGEALFCCDAPDILKMVHDLIE